MNSGPLSLCRTLGATPNAAMTSSWTTIVPAAVIRRAALVGMASQVNSSDPFTDRQGTALCGLVAWQVDGPDVVGVGSSHLDGIASHLGLAATDRSHT